MESWREIRRKRLSYGSVGFVVGAAIDLFVRWSLQGRLEFLEAFFAGCAGAALLLAYAQGHGKVRSAEDLSATRLDEKAHPLGVSRERSTGAPAKEQQ